MVVPQVSVESEWILAFELLVGQHGRMWTVADYRLVASVSGTHGWR